MRFIAGMHFQRAAVLALMALSVYTAGCGGDSGPPTAAVSGTLTIDGKPVPGVEVRFLNAEYAKHNALGVTNEAGEYRLIQGAVPGPNTVYFSKIEGGAAIGDAESGMDAGQLEAEAMGVGKNAKDVGPKQIVPQEYSTASSKLVFDVPESGTDSADFSL